MRPPAAPQAHTTRRNQIGLVTPPRRTNRQWPVFGHSRTPPPHSGQRAPSGSAGPTPHPIIASTSPTATNTPAPAGTQGQLPWRKLRFGVLAPLMAPANAARYISATTGAAELREQPSAARGFSQPCGVGASRRPPRSGPSPAPPYAVVGGTDEHQSRGFPSRHDRSGDPAMGQHRPQRHSPCGLTKLNGEVRRRRVRGETRPTVPGRRGAGTVRRAARSSPVGRSAS